jgi:hypothetical protein
VPLMQTWFGTADVNFTTWLIILCIGMLILFVVEAEKALVRWWGSGKNRSNQSNS